MPAGDLTKSTYNYGNKWYKSGVREWPRGFCTQSAPRGCRDEVKVSHWLLFILPIPGWYRFHNLSWKQCPVLGLALCKALITKWTAPALLWLSLCAPLCMGTQRVSLDTQTTQQLSLRWMPVYAGSQGVAGASRSLLQGLCERRKVTFSLHHKG